MKVFEELAKLDDRSLKTRQGTRVMRDAILELVKLVQGSKVTEPKPVEYELKTKRRD